MKFAAFYAQTIPVRDAKGRQLEEIRLPEAVRPGFQRRGGFSDSGFYYKGAGILYSGHLADRVSPGMIQTGENPCPYQRYRVIYPNLYGQHGIFTFRHQPVFSDFEGGCGPKEEKLLWMQQRFRYSAIDGEVETIPTPLPGHRIYRYRLKERKGSYRDTVRLLEYVLAEDFNCPWDKNIWGDIYAYGYVRDLADWFVSKEESHKLGTVYAFLNSIFAADRYLYSYLTNRLTGWEQLEPAYLPFVAAHIVRRASPGFLAEYDLREFSVELYDRLLRLLYDGKACCHLEDEAHGAGVRDVFREEIPKRAAAMEQLLRYSQRKSPL